MLCWTLISSVKSVLNVTYTTFVGLVIDDTLTWDNHIDQLISRLDSACYAVRSLKETMLMNALRMLYIFFLCTFCTQEKCMT
jgi:hypothetical protein